MTTTTFNKSANNYNTIGGQSPNLYAQTALQNNPLFSNLAPLQSNNTNQWAPKDVFQQQQQQTPFNLFEANNNPAPANQFGRNPDGNTQTNMLFGAGNLAAPTAQQLGLESYTAEPTKVGTDNALGFTMPEIQIPEVKIAEMEKQEFKFNKDDIETEKGMFDNMTGKDWLNAGVNTIGAVGSLWSSIASTNAMKDKVQVSRDALNFDIAKDTRLQDAYKAARST